MNAKLGPHRRETHSRLFSAVLLANADPRALGPPFPISASFNLCAHNEDPPSVMDITSHLPRLCSSRLLCKRTNQGTLTEDSSIACCLTYPPQWQLHRLSRWSFLRPCANTPRVNGPDQHHSNPSHPKRNTIPLTAIVHDLP